MPKHGCCRTNTSETFRVRKLQTVSRQDWAWNERVESVAPSSCWKNNSENVADAAESLNTQEGKPNEAPFAPIMPWHMVLRVVSWLRQRHHRPSKRLNTAISDVRCSRIEIGDLA